MKVMFKTVVIRHHVCHAYLLPTAQYRHVHPFVRMLALAQHELAIKYTVVQGKVLFSGCASDASEACWLVRYCQQIQ